MLAGSGIGRILEENIHTSGRTPPGRARYRPRMVKATHGGGSDSGRETPKVVSVVTLDGRAETALLALAASVACGLEAPLAAAILDCASEREVRVDGVDWLDQTTGSGVAARIAGQRVVLGNATFFTQLGLSLESLGEWPERLQRQ